MCSSDLEEEGWWQAFSSFLWEDANAAALKAHKVLSVDSLNPLMAKSFGKVVQRSDVVSHLETHASMC